MMGASLVIPANAAKSDASDAKANGKTKSEILAGFKAKSGEKFKLYENDGHIYVSGDLSEKRKADKQDAENFINENKALFGADAENSEELCNNVTFEANSAVKDKAGNTFISVVQKINGLRVLGCDLNIRYNKKGEILSINGKYQTNQKITMLDDSSISEKEAVNIAEKQFKFNKLDEAPSGEKILIGKEGKLYEAYEIEINYSDPEIGAWDVYIDTHSGEVLQILDNLRYSAATGSGRNVQGVLLQSLNFDLQGSTYYMTDLTKTSPTVLNTYTMNHSTSSYSLVQNSSSTFDTEDYKAGVSGHYNTGLIYDFYKDTNLFDRNSIDNNGMAINTMVHYGNSVNNAFWDIETDKMYFGDGDGLNRTYFTGDIDCIAHEYTHGVVEKAVGARFNGNNTVYYGQSGAINESLADVMAVLTETYYEYDVKTNGMNAWTYAASDWKIADDISLLSGGSLRNLANPAPSGLPANMSDYNYTTSDHGGVHINCSIMSLAALGVANSIGMEKTAKLYYKYITNHMTTEPDFIEAYNCILDSAAELQYTTAEISSIEDAYENVGIVNEVSYAVPGGQILVDTSDNTVSGYTGSPTDITIPDHIGGYMITAIGAGAFSGCTSLTSVVLPTSITTIGDNAFANCSSLITVSIPESILEDAISDSAFSQRNTNLVLYGKTGSSAQAYAVNNGISFSAVYNYPVTGGYITFSLAGSVTGFTGSPTTVEIPSAILGYTVTAIGAEALKNCTSMTSLTLPQTLTCVYQYAFQNCTGLTSITIPTSVTVFSSFALVGCANLTAINVNVANTVYSSENGILFNKNKTTLMFYPCAKSDSSYSVPSSVTTIGSNAFNGSSNLKLISVPYGVTSIGQNAFIGCTNLSRLALPTSLTTIGGYCFSNTLTSIVIPESVTSIDNNAFYLCSNLTIYGKSNSSAEDYANSKQKTFVAYSEHQVSGGYLYFASTAGSIIGYSGSLQTLDIPSSIGGSNVTSIADFALSGCTGLGSVILPNTVTAIGNGAYYGCNDLTSIWIPSSSTTIGTSAFFGCGGLTIYGKSGSNAQTYATQNSIQFSSTYNYPVTGGYLAFNLQAGTITGFGGSPSTVEIPSSINNISVTGIANNAFLNCTSLTSLTIPSSVTSINTGAFLGCSNLAAINVDSSNTVYSSIDGVLYNKAGTSFLKWPEAKGTVCAIPSGVTSIDTNAFYGCTGITSVTIPSSVTSINAGAFLGCTNLSAINVDSSNTVYSSISGALYNKAGTSFLKWPEAKGTVCAIPNGVTSIGQNAFYGCIGLTSVTIPCGVTDIGTDAFYGCTGLTQIVIPSSVTNVGYGILYGCTNLESAVILNDSTEFYLDTFAYCQNLTVYGIDQSTAEDEAANCNVDFASYYAYAVPGGAIKFDIETAGITGFTGSPTNVAIPDSIFGLSVTNIGINAFYGCTSLTGVTIPDSVTEIGIYAFYGCTGLTQIVIPSSVTNVRYGILYNCTNLESAVVLNSTTQFFADSFVNCPNLTVYGIDGSTAEDEAGYCYVDFATYYDYAVTGGTIRFDIATKSITGFGGSPTNIAIPDTILGVTVTGIGTNAFYGCTSLTGVTIPDSVTEIGIYAFYGCTGLTQIVIPSSVTNVRYGILYNCTNLESAVILNSTTQFFADSFVNCPNLTVYGIDGSTAEDEAGYCYVDFATYYDYAVTGGTIRFDIATKGISAFGGSPTGVVIPSAILGASVTKIGSNAFYGCTSLTGVTIPDSVTEIGSYAFYGCTGLTQIVIPSSVTNVCYGILYGCTNLESAVVLNSTTQFFADSFVDCPNLIVYGIDGSTAEDEAANCNVDFATYYDYAVTGGTIRFDIETKGISGFASSPTSAVIPSTILGVIVTSIGTNAFYGCANLTAVTIPSSVTYIADSAFTGLSNLTIYGSSGSYAQTYASAHSITFVAI